MPWRFLPHFLLRSTGFPIEDLLRLHFDRTTAALDRLAEVDDTLDAEAERVAGVLADSSDTAPLRLRRRCYQRISRHERVKLNQEQRSALSACAPVLDAWNDLLSRRDELARLAAEAFAGELPDLRATLAKIVSDERFGEAVWLSSPQMWSGGLRRYLDGRGSPTDLRRVERQLTAYLQRFCAKNDTNSFFGPIDWGRLARDGEPRSGGGALRGGTTTHREAFLAHWAVQALADAIATDPEMTPFLRPSVNAMCAVSPDARCVAGPGRDPFTLSARAAAVLSRVSGEVSVADIAEAAGVPLAQTLTRLDQLRAAGIVHLAPRVPVIAVRPAAWLRAWVAALPGSPARDRWLAELDALRDAERRFAGSAFTDKRSLLADAEERFEKLAAVTARRAAGELYGDRLVMYEEAAGGASPLVLGPEATRELSARLVPVLGHFAAHAVAAQHRLRAAGADWIRRLAGPDGTVPLVSLVHELRGVDPPPEPTGWQDAVRAQLAGHEGEQAVELAPATLPSAEPGELAGETLVTSLDLMLVPRPGGGPDAVRSGEFDIVIGECHDTLLVWGWPLTFHPGRAEVEHAGAEAFGAARGGRVLANVRPTRRVKIIPFQYPGPTVHLGAVPPHVPDAIPIGAVRARLVDGVPVLTAPGRERFGLYNGELHTFAHRIFGPPRVVPPPAVDAGPHTPRLLLNGVVVQRERWRLAPGELFCGRYHGDAVELMRDFRRAARRWRLPRYVFARADGERKPVFVDTTNWFSLQVLHHLMHHPAERAVTLTEMLPGPDQLWLPGDSGRHCAELRLAAFHEPGAGP